MQRDKRGRHVQRQLDFAQCLISELAFSLSKVLSRGFIRQIDHSEVSFKSAAAIRQ